MAYFSQDDSQNDEEKEGDWNQLGAQAKRRYRKMRQEVSAVPRDKKRFIRSGVAR